MAMPPNRPMAAVTRAGTSTSKKSTASRAITLRPATSLVGTFEARCHTIIPPATSS